MASEFDTISTQITKPSPVIEGSLSNFLPFIDMLSKGAVDSSFSGINTANYDPKVAAQTALQTGAASNAAGLGSLVGPGMNLPAGVQPGSIEAYMSPYQQQVIDASLSEFDRNAAVQNVGLRDNAISMGAYGGGREGVMAAEAMRGNNMNRAQLQAQLLNQGFQQAQAARGTDLQAQQGLGTYQSQMGAGQQGFEQAKLDASQIAAREAEFAPFTQLGLVGQQLAQIQPGAFPTQTVGYAPPAAPASPMSQFLGAGAGIGGMMGKLGLMG
jgi:hypothetical protein